MGWRIACIVRVVQIRYELGDVKRGKQNVRRMEEGGQSRSRIHFPMHPDMGISQIPWSSHAGRMSIREPVIFAYLALRRTTM